MEVYFQYIRDAEALGKACEKLKASEFLGFDTETTELDPHRGDIRLVQLSDGNDTVVIDLKPFRENGGVKTNPALEPLRSLLASEQNTKIAHNAKFDAKLVRHHLGVEVGSIYDTYLGSQLISAGDSDRRHSLADLAQFFLGTELDKTEQISDWSADELTQSQIEYAARDAAIMVRLKEKVHERLVNDQLDRVAALEFACVMPIAEMELNGFYLDESLWRKQLEKVLAEQDIVADELQGMLSAGVAQASLFGRAEINLDSQQQVTDALLNLGVPVPDTTRAWVLQPLAEKYPVIEKLLSYRGVAKSISSFGETFLDFIEPSTKRVHADFRQIGAPSGRFSCSNPNLQQIPHEKEYRRCFRAEAGRTLVIADYSQIELRILAAFSNDRQFIDAFESGVDFHTMTAAQVFNTKPADVTPEQRSFAKRLNFGVVYGIGASRFGMMTGLSQNDAENTLRRYFATYRGLDAYLREAGNRVVSDRTARTASGRMMRLRFDPADRQQVSAARRNGINMPIQGTSADILKRALRILHDNLRGTSGKLVNIVHDEIIVECETQDSSDIARTLEDAMCKAGAEFISNVPVKVDVNIADDWTK
jgi:DNA polymerase I-like protein with 3'-5' exonuclease and polymerase domains